MLDNDSRNLNDAEAYFSRGTELLDHKQFNAAIACFEKAIRLNPGNADAYVNRGVALQELRRLDEALESYNGAIRLNPGDEDAYVNRGTVLKELKRLNEALASYKRAIQLNPEVDYLLGNLINTKMHLCDWDSLNILINQLIEKNLQNQKTSVPFTTLALIDNLKFHQQSAKIYADTRYPKNKILPSLTKYPKHQQIRIGYFSADFREHPVSYLTAELFELHNRDQFEIIAFSFGGNTQDRIRKRLENAFDQFLDVKDKTDQEITALARKMEIDIAIDLGGFTKGSRTNIFAMRAAPIQLSYIGYLGSMGAEYYDYLIADPTIIPQGYEQYYSEKIAYLPSYQVNDTKLEISEKIFTRSELGLPIDGFVFCCFNSVYKITPSTFDSWMRILLAVQGSVLFLLDANETATNNLNKEANARGISSDRLIFGKSLPRPEYLARYRIPELFLDTLPYNAGTTASDALRMGLPVLTLMGESFASRMAASLLNAVRLPELITENQEAYESLAIELATNPQKLEAIKNKLVNNLPTSPLYNTKLFTQQIESAYQTMYQRYQNDLPPDHIKIT